MIEGVNPRLIRKGELGVARAEQDDRPHVVAAPGEIGGQTGLAGPGLTADQHHLATARTDPVPCLLQHGPFGIATDQRLPYGRGDPRRQRHVRLVNRGTGVGDCLGGQPIDGEDLCWPAAAVELEQPDRKVIATGDVGREPAHDVVDQDLHLARRERVVRQRR